MNSGYLKFILTLLTLAVAGAGYFITTALDRLRESNYVLADRLKEAGRTGMVRNVPQAAPQGKVQVSPAQPGGKTVIANQ